MENSNKLRQQLQRIVFHKAASTTNNVYSKKVFADLARCHTQQQGMHRLRCKTESCLFETYQYHNCGNRHCPNCGGMRREQWLEDKMSELLPTGYYHVVFTLPHTLNGLIMGNRTSMFKLLFEASSYTLLKLGKDPKWLGATPGIISILHTWGQDLSFHPHIHCIVSGGGIVEKPNLKWISDKRKNKTFLYPKPVMQTVYRAYFLKRCNELLKQGLLKATEEMDIEKLLHDVENIRWNVEARKPFAGPAQVLEYIGRYTHKVAITAHRILEINEQKQTIRFKYKDYRERNSGNMLKEMPLSITEFIRRFEQHILPKGFVKIRHYGYLKNHNRSDRLLSLFQLLKLPPPPPKLIIPVRQRMLEKHGVDIFECPECKQSSLYCVATYRHGVLIAVHEPQSSPSAQCSPSANRLRNKEPT